MYKKIRYESFNNADNLPEEWNFLAKNNMFLRRENLSIIEKSNPCCQEYNIFYRGAADSIIVTYRLLIDIFTYSSFSLKIPATIIGVPLSVSTCGYIIGNDTRNDVMDFLRSIRGARLILNSEATNDILEFSKGTTLPSCRLDLIWKNFDEYVNNMRSSYRYRVHKAVKRWQDIRVKMLDDNSKFDEKLYRLYLNVYYRSQYKLEKLKIDFFKSFPSKITVFLLGDTPLAFVQTIENGDELFFLFGGFDYDLNFIYDIYMNMLLHIIKMGIEGGYKTLDLGQTGEDTKLKLGCKLRPKTLYASHSSPFINFAVKKSINLLSYHEEEHRFNVFKENNYEDIAGPAGI